MALLTKHTAFFHVPKTGGFWVEAALKNCGLLTGYAPNMRHPCSFHHTPPIAAEKWLLEGGAWEKQWWFLVRDPATQWRSHWQYIHHRLTHGIGFEGPRKRWENWGIAGLPMPSIRNCYSPNFNEFIHNVIKDRPGWLTNLYFMYMDKYPERMAWGKYERLEDECIRILRAAGEEFDETRFRLKKKLNAAQVPNPLYERSILEELMEREAEIYEFFGYPLEVDESLCVSS